MGRYEKVLNMLMDYDESIRLAVISNTSGDILWNSKRSDTKLQVPIAETKKALKRTEQLNKTKIEMIKPIKTANIFI